MFHIFLWFGALLRIFRTRQSLLLENLALGQQLAVFKRKHPRPRIGRFDRVFWVVARRFWSNWKHWLLLLTPDTVVRWHRAGFRFYWRLICRSGMRTGRTKIPKEIRDLIFQMVAENPTWRTRGRARRATCLGLQAHQPHTGQSLVANCRMGPYRRHRGPARS